MPDKIYLPRSSFITLLKTEFRGRLDRRFSYLPGAKAPLENSDTNIDIVFRGDSERTE